MLWYSTTGRDFFRAGKKRHFSLFFSAPMMIIAQKTWLADPSADPSWVSLFRVEPQSYPPIISTAQLQYNGAMQAHKQNSQAEINRGEYRNFSRICDLLFCLILPFVLPLYGMTCDKWTVQSKYGSGNRVEPTIIYQSWSIIYVLNNHKLLYFPCEF